MTKLRDGQSGAAADRLLWLRVRIPPGEWMFLSCVLYSKGQKAKPGQSGQRGTDKVQRTKIGNLGIFFPGIKWPGREADNILLVSSLRISGVTPLLLIHAFYGVHREFYFHFCCTFWHSKPSKSNHRLRRPPNYATHRQSKISWVSFQATAFINAGFL